MSKNKIKKSHGGVYLSWITTITLFTAIVASTFLTVIFTQDGSGWSQGEKDTFVIIATITVFIFLIMSIYLAVTCKKIMKYNQDIEFLKVLFALSITLTVVSAIAFLVCFGAIIVALFSFLIVVGFIKGWAWHLLNWGVTYLMYSVYVFWPVSVLGYATLTVFTWIKCRKIPAYEKTPKYIKNPSYEKK